MQIAPETNHFLYSFLLVREVKLYIDTFPPPNIVMLQHPTLCHISVG